jgi:hypothetical protein
MEEQITAFGYTLAVNRVATVKAYERILVPYPEQCRCIWCRNWVAGREVTVPGELREVLLTLGVPLNGEIEVWQVPGIQKACLYGGWYMVVGRLLDAPGPEKGTFEVGGWQISCSQGSTLQIEAFAGQDVFELGFLTESDWFIPEDMP